MSDREADLHQAQQAWMLGDFGAAYALYERLLQTDPRDARVLMDYGRAKYEEFTDLQQSAELFERTHQAQPDAIEPLLWLGDLCWMGYGPGYEAAAEMYRRVIQLDPSSVDAYIGLGMTHGSPGGSTTLEEAVTAYRKATELGPERADAFVNLGNALIESGDFIGAIGELSVAESLFVKDGDHRQAKSVHLLIGKLTRQEPVTNYAYINMPPRYSKSE